MNPLATPSDGEWTMESGIFMWVIGAQNGWADGSLFGG